MAWIAAAAVVGGALISGITGDKAAKRAADAQTQAADASIAEQRRQYDLTRGDQLGQYEQARTDQAPYRKSGSLALDKLTAGISGGGVDAMAQKILRAFPTWTATDDPGKPGTSQQIVDSFLRHAPEIVKQGGEAFGYKGYDQVAKDLLQEMQGGAGGILATPDLLRRFSADDLQKDPVYQSGLQFGLDQGTGAINSRAIAGGGYDSGATIKALTRFANDYGSTKANESYNRYNQDQSNIYNKLAGITGTGQTATNQVGAAGQNMVNQLGAAGQNTANQVSESIAGAGNARAAGIVGGANAWTNAINQGYKNYQYSQYPGWGKYPSSGGYGGGTQPEPYPGYYDYGNE